MLLILIADVMYEDFFIMVCCFVFFDNKHLLLLLLSMSQIYSNVFISRVYIYIIIYLYTNRNK